MNDFSQYMLQARKDVESCIEIWTDIFEENYNEKIEYMYSKGSATKEWGSLIDYVPIISDVDIHIKIHEDATLFENLTDAFINSIGVSQTYEDIFVEKNTNHLHIPRTQIVNMSDIKNSESFIFPKIENVRVLMGKYPKFKDKPADFIRRIDRFNLIEQEDFLATLPKTIIDRTGIDLWTLIRRMVWRVSPSPIRLLTQTHDEPMDLWNFNRTELVAILEEKGYEQIAENYQDYYYEGWLAFLDGFSDSVSMRRVISLGFEIINDCIEEMKKIGI